MNLESSALDLRGFYFISQKPSQNKVFAYYYLTLFIRRHYRLRRRGDTDAGITSSEEGFLYGSRAPNPIFQKYGPASVILLLFINYIYIIAPPLSLFCFCCGAIKN